LKKFGISEFLHHICINQLAFGENVFDMLIAGRLGFAEQPSHVGMGQPDRLVFKPDIDFDFAVGGLAKKDFRIIHAAGSMPAKGPLP
jgi:hypothetical protein